MTEIRHLTRDELDAELDGISQSPSDGGELQMIVRRPDVDERDILETGALTAAAGLVGDNWRHRSTSSTDDGSPKPDQQLTLMNARVIGLVAREKKRWPLAGDQLFVDLDLSAANLPPRTRLKLGSAIIEITAESHTGCRKFGARFGLPALKFINGREVHDLRLRGIYAKVVQDGVIRVGDRLLKID